MNVKKELRQKINAVLNKLPNDEKGRQSKEISLQLISSSCFRSAKSVAVFLSKSSEVSTLEIVKESFNLTKRVFVPLIFENRLKLVRAFSFEDILCFATNRWGIPEPDLETANSRDDALNTGVDLIICPGLAFDAKCNRLGYGKGYYDSFFAKYFAKFPREKNVSCADWTSFDLTAHPNFGLKIGIGFAEQLIPSVPVSEKDVSLDGIIIASSLDRHDALSSPNF